MSIAAKKQNLHTTPPLRQPMTQMNSSDPLSACFRMPLKALELQVMIPTPHPPPHSPPKTSAYLSVITANCFSYI